MYLIQNNLPVATTEVSNLRLDTRKAPDDLDARIIALLQEDSRLSFNKIAAKLGISVGTAHNRVKNLEKQRLLKGYTVLLDSAKLGFDLTALILIQTVGKYHEEVESEIAKTSHVIAAYDIAGDYDAAIITKFRDRTSLNNFVKKLLSSPHVRRTVTSVALSVIKEDCLTRLCDLQNEGRH